MTLGPPLSFSAGRERQRGTRASPQHPCHLTAELSHTHALGAGSPTPCHQGRLYCAGQMRCRACSPECCHRWEVGPVRSGASSEDPWTSVWSQAAAQTRDIHMAFSSNMNHGYQYRFLLLHPWPWTQTWPSAAAWDFTMASGGRPGY